MSSIKLHKSKWKWKLKKNNIHWNDIQKAKKPFCRIIKHVNFNKLTEGKINLLKWESQSKTKINMVLKSVTFKLPLINNSAYNSQENDWNSWDYAFVMLGLGSIPL